MFVCSQQCIINNLPRFTQSLIQNAIILHVLWYVLIFDHICTRQTIFFTSQESLNLIFEFHHLLYNCVITEEVFDINRMNKGSKSQFRALFN